MGKIRAGIDEKFVQTKLAQAWQAHPDYTMKIIFKTRDCRGGKGIIPYISNQIPTTKTKHTHTHR